MVEISPIAADDITRLKFAAASFRAGILKSNFLPDAFPQEELTLIAEQLEHIDRSDAEIALQTLIYSRDKLLSLNDQCFKDIDQSASEHLRNLHNGLIVEASRISAKVSRRNIDAVLGGIRTGSLSVDANAYERSLVELRDECRAALKEIRENGATVNHVDLRQQISLIQFEKLSFAIDGIFKSAASITVEIGSRIIDLSWISAFSKSLEDYARKLQAASRELIKHAPSLEYVVKRVEAIVSRVRSIVRKATEFVKTALQDAAARIDTIIASNRMSPSSAPDSAAQELGVRLRDLENRYMAQADSIANLSHELRTPLNTVIGFAELLQAEKMGPLGSEKYRSYLDNLQKSAKYLVDLVGDLPQVWSADFEKIILNEDVVSIGALFTKAAKFCESGRLEKKLTLHFRVPENTPRVAVDFPRMVQALTSVIAHVFAACGVGSNVLLGSRMSADSLILEISDLADKEPSSSGSGTVGGRTPEYDAYTALGTRLYFANQIVKLHGGSMNFSSGAYGPTRVTIRIPKDRLENKTTTK